jgi:multidrug efflux system membrane fusion protein
MHFGGTRRWSLPRMNKGTLSKLGVVGLMAGLVVAGWFIVSDVGRDKARAASTQVPPVPVIMGVATTKDMPVLVRGIGTVQAYETVAVKTRVDGQIVKVAFTEGQFVKSGDLLFQIDPAPLQAVLDHANAAKQRDEAQLAGARLDLERYGKLIGSGYQSRQSYDQQHATVDALTATVALDQATIDTAKVNLAFTDIRAPIDGRTGQRLVDVGNVLQASQPVPLVNITRIKPIFVNFTVPQDITDAIRRAQAAAPLTVMAFAADDKTQLSQGRLTLIDNQIDQATGTLRLKATFENADERLWPGEFVNVRLVIDVRVGAVTVPERAIVQGPDGYYAYTVNPDNTVQRHPVDVAGMQDGLAVISQGIADGDKIVVDGQYRLSEGSRVKIDTASPPAPAAAGKTG